METLASSRIIVSGISASQGASLFGIGLASELKRRGLSVSASVVGPQLLQAVIYRRLIGRLVRCLDDRLLTPGQNLVGAYQSTVGAEVLLIQGAHGGLYDGASATSLRGSTADMAGLLHTPVALVADPEGFGNSLGALVRGYVDAARDFAVSGVTVANVDVAEQDVAVRREHYESIMQLFTAPPVFGVLPRVASEVPLPGAGFSQGVNRTSLPRQFLVDVSGMVNRHVDVDALLASAARAIPIKISDYEHRPFERRARIAVSDDVCFSLLFQDNFDLLRFYGAEIVPFSPLADAGLPRKVGAVYLTGGYLNDYGGELAANKSMLQSLRDFAADGGVVYSEGAGTAYLAEDFRVPGNDALQGAGVFPGSAIANPEHFAYCDTVTVDESVLGRAGLIVKGVATNEWRMANEEPMVRALRVSVLGNPSTPEGFSPGAQILGTFSFLHFGSNPEIAKNLVDAAQVVQKIS